MAEIIVLPQQGNSVESCIIQTWHVAVGDEVAVDQTVCEVETDKATLEVPATSAGTVLKLYAAEGDEVPVMDPLLAVGKAGEAAPDAGGGASDAASSGAAANNDAPAETGTPAAGAVGSAPAAGLDAPERTAAAGDGRRPHRASPRARQLAEKLGIDVTAVAGSGPGGRVIVRDVEAADKRGDASIAAASGTTGSVPAGAPGAASAAPASYSPAGFADVPVSGVRAVIAERMEASLRNSAQLTLHASADARALQAYRARVKARATDGDVANISINDMVNFAVSRVLPLYLDLNAHYLGDTIRKFSGVDLGFAVDTNRGLLVPTIVGADRRSLTDLHLVSRELAERAQSGKASRDDMSPATFTVTNLGALGVEYFTPVLNIPQVAILGVGGILPRLDKNGEVIPQIALSLTIDHRAVDGAPAARFLQALCADIADFDLLLAR